MKGAANKQAGSRFERRVAKLSGGKRRPLSVDDTPIGGILEPNFRIESKWGVSVPKFFWDAYRQAEGNGAIGDNRPSAVIVGKAYENPLFIAKLTDVLSVMGALAETGRGPKLREFARQLDSISAELRRIT